MLDIRSCRRLDIAVERDRENDEFEKLPEKACGGSVWPIFLMISRAAVGSKIVRIARIVDQT
jgi:hypothetical protein